MGLVVTIFGRLRVREQYLPKFLVVPSKDFSLSSQIAALHVPQFFVVVSFANKRLHHVLLVALHSFKYMLISKRI